MALKLHTTYPGRFDSPSENYPQGKWRNRSNSTAHDGGYLEEQHMNDIYGFFGALLRNAEMSPNGEVDTAKKSQFYDALVTVAKKVVGEEGYRKLGDNVFNGYLQVRSEHEGQGTGVFLQDTDGTVRGQVVATDQGLRLTQYPKDGGLQTFTFPSEGNGGELALTSYVDAQIEAIPESDSIPVGVIKAYAGETAPNDKWLLCRGQAFSAESYPALAQLLPDLKIPDLRGVALRGLDANRGLDPGRALLSYQEDAMQQVESTTNGLHAQVYDDSAPGVVNWKRAPSITGAAVDTGVGASLTFDLSKGARTSHETVMKNVAVNFIIKAR